VTASRSHHHLDRLAVVHRAIAVGHAVKTDDAIEDAAGVDPPFEDVRQELVDVGADRRRAAARL
jgi:hypothetical protein